MSITLNKVAGMSVFPRHDDPSAPCVLRRLLASEEWRTELAWPEGFEGGIVHRLDISTSGALLVASDLTELEELRGSFARKALRKSYLLRAARDPAWNSHRCDAAIAHDKRKRRRMVVQRGSNTPHRGRWHEAQTEFERVEGDLWRATMRSGVMHQIRVHAAFIGLPLLGDRMYGGGPTPPSWPEGRVFCLHHEGLRGPGVATEPVPEPEWARR